MQRRAISNTSPLIYLHYVDGLSWLGELFTSVMISLAVRDEINMGYRRGYSSPSLGSYPWLEQASPSAAPSEWLAIDLGAGEREALALALDHPKCIILLDDALARRIAGAAGMTVWGTLCVTVEAKRVGLLSEIKPTPAALRRAGMWFSPEIENRVLGLAGEA